MCRKGLVYVATTPKSILSQHVDSNYKWSVKISTFIATIYLKGLLLRKVHVASLQGTIKSIEILEK